MVLIESKFIENIICSEVITEEAPNLIKIGEEMIKFCVEKGGIGLAAPQIGLLKKMFIWRIGEDKEGQNFQIVFNPKFYKNGKETRMIEGCLSYGENHYIVKRWKNITAVFYTFHNGIFHKISRQLSGIRAVIFQHETWHIEGKTIAMEGEKLDEQKNSDFISTFQKREINKNITSTKNDNKQEAAVVGSALYSFEPNK